MLLCKHSFEEDHGSTPTESIYSSSIEKSQDCPRYTGATFLTYSDGVHLFLVDGEVIKASEVNGSELSRVLYHKHFETQTVRRAVRVVLAILKEEKSFRYECRGVQTVRNAISVIFAILKEERLVRL